LIRAPHGIGVGVFEASHCGHRAFALVTVFVDLGGATGVAAEPYAALAGPGTCAFAPKLSGAMVRVARFGLTLDRKSALAPVKPLPPSVTRVANCILTARAFGASM
jgi:hypothetical protein